MKTWCSNIIDITGDKDKIKELVTKIREISSGDNPILFQTLVGHAHTNTIGSKFVYYGTDWDVSVDDCNGKFDETHIKLSPKTVDTPPIPFCKTLAKEYGVNVTISYTVIKEYSGHYEFNDKGETVVEID